MINQYMSDDNVTLSSCVPRRGQDIFFQVLSFSGISLDALDRVPRILSRV